MPECPMCNKYYEGVEIPKDIWNDPDDRWCPDCVNIVYENAVAKFKKRCVLKRLTAIEKALPDSTNPAKLRLERSFLDSELEKIEEVIGE